LTKQANSDKLAKCYTWEAVAAVSWLNRKSVGGIWACAHVCSFWRWNAEMTAAAIVYRARIGHACPITTSN